MSNEIKELLELKAKKEQGGKRDKVEDVKFYFLNTKLKIQTRNWRPELGNLVTHDDKYMFHLNQLLSGSKRQAWVCRLAKAPDNCLGKATTSEDESGKNKSIQK